MFLKSWRVPLVGPFLLFPLWLSSSKVTGAAPPWKRKPSCDSPGDLSKGYAVPVACRAYATVRTNYCIKAFVFLLEETSVISRLRAMFDVEQ